MASYDKVTRLCSMKYGDSDDIVPVPDAIFHCSAYQIAGAPDVYPTYGDMSEAWAPRTEKRAEFLELMFLTSVQVTGIDIYETHLGGAVSAVKCYQNGGYTTLWTSPSIERIIFARIFQPQLATGCFSNRIKLEIAAITGWVNIDAVQLHGYI
ncbi:hypothetical protein MAR_001173 [Mya arenaria]|uniref:Pappalysin-1 SD scarf domain-containing protein n=1 Tax=Mya arenaria TaxID=6604 RepID=A0ABY7FB53_MYAAR|nr:hypothetical protein MAR_001173 [Mya arenaria]